MDLNKYKRAFTDLLRDGRDKALVVGDEDDPAVPHVQRAHQRIETLRYLQHQPRISS